MSINSFDDVAKHIANENSKLSDRIVEGFKNEISKIRDDMKGEIDTLSRNVHKTIHNVENQQSAQDMRIAQLEDTVARMQRMSELVISGVPFTANESCVSIVLKIASVINCTVNENAVRAFRLNKTGQNTSNKKRQRDSDTVISPIIMVKFPSTADKNAFFAKYLARKNLNLTDIGFKVPHRIYVKENLTPYNYKIFQACENAKRSGVIDKYFTRDGTCHISLQPNGKAIMVQSLKFFHETVNSNYNTNRSTRHFNDGGKKKAKKQRNDNQPIAQDKSTGQHKSTGKHFTRSQSGAHVSDDQPWAALMQPLHSSKPKSSSTALSTSTASI